MNTTAGSYSLLGSVVPGEAGVMRRLRAAGAIVLGDAPSYAPPATEPELYVQAFVTDRERRGQGVGAALLERACAETVARGLRVLRLDCWGGGDRALVRYYERAGFTPTERFLVGAWEGQVLERRFPGPGPAA